MNTFPAQAHGVAAQGRGDDSMLVHMSPQEVAGLNALAQQHYGRGLSVNPHTGLPEAGILGSLIPMLAGAALTATGVGAPMAALLVGGGTALATHNMGRGLMAGMGAYGGAGMGTALGNMGDASTAATSIGTDTAAQTAAQSAMQQEAAAQGGAGAMTDPTMWDGIPGVDTPPTTGIADPQAAFRASEIAGQNAGGIGGAAPMGAMDRMGAGLGQLTQPGGFQQFVDAQGGGKKAMMNGMMGLMGGAGANIGVGGNKIPSYVDAQGNIRPYSYNPYTHHFTALPAYAANTLGTRPFAAGGSTAPAYNFNPQSRVFMPQGGAMPQSIAQPGGQQPMQDDASAYRYSYNPSTQAFSHLMPAATQPPMPQQPYNPAVQQLVDYGSAGGGEGGGYASGGIAGLLQGPGDGTSDSIPAQMSGSGQPAALGDGEFVVPARIVAELGNGSTSAGARQLYAMMSRVDQMRRKTSMAGDSNAASKLPA